MEMMTLKTEIQQIADGVYAIDQEMVRSFLVLGETSALLLDAGAQWIDDFREMLASITQLPIKLVLSHSDGDHTANLAQFTDVWVHPDEVYLVTKHPERAEGINIHHITEGELLDLGGRVLEVVHLPGHTPGSIGLIDRDYRVLYSGDTVSYGPVFLFDSHRDPDKYLETLKRLKGMAEEKLFDTIYPCHNTCPIGSDSIDELIACVEGAMAGTLEAETVVLPVPGEPEVLMCKVGNCSVFYQD